MGSNTRFAFVVTTAVAAVLLLSVPNLRAAQDPAGQQDAAPPELQPAPENQQQGADPRPVTSRDRFPEDQQPSAATAERPPSPNRPPARPTTPAPVPASLVIPGGTVIFARLAEPLSSDRNQAGDTFTATLDRPIVVDGWVVARRGETIVGSVTSAQKAGRVKGVSQLGLELTDLTVVDGQQLPVLTELWKASAGTSRGTDAAGVAATAGAGTILGAAADGGTGAGIGAGAGAAAAIAMVLLTRGKPTVLAPETLLSFRLKDPVTIPTTRSRQAFLPVGPKDYGSAPTLQRRGDPYVAYPSPPPYYAACGPYVCAPYYAYGYGPAFAFTYYGGYGHRGGWYRFRR
jgi:hypothetical protein